MTTFCIQSKESIPKQKAYAIETYPFSMQNNKADKYPIVYQ